VVMIDDIKLYCDAARNEGLDAIHYTSLEQLKYELMTKLYLK